MTIGIVVAARLAILVYPDPEPDAAPLSVYPELPPRGGPSCEGYRLRLTGGLRSQEAPVVALGRP